MIKSFTICYPQGQDIEKEISEELGKIIYRRIISIETVEQYTVKVWYEVN